MASFHQHLKRHRRAVSRLKLASDLRPAPVINDDGGWVEGWISPAVIDRAGEYVPPDEWKLHEHAKNPVGFVNHNRNEIPALRWAHPDGRYSVEVRPEGLWGRAYFNLATKAGQDLYASYKSGHMRGFSAGFHSNRPQTGTVRGQSARILKNAVVFEISAVGVPENQDAIRTNVKSAADSAGNYPIPDGKVLRLGAYPMADATTETPNAEHTVVNDKAAKTYDKGPRGFIEAMVSGLTGLFTEAKTLLSDATADDRNEAYGLAGDAYVCAKSMTNAGRAKFGGSGWDDADKAIDAAFDGFADAVKAQETEDDAVTAEHLKSLAAEVVADKLKPVLADIEAVKGHVDNHEAALTGLTEVVESTLAN